MRLRLEKQIVVPGTGKWEQEFTSENGWACTVHSDTRITLSHDDYQARPIAFDVCGIGYTIDPPQDRKRK